MKLKRREIHMHKEPPAVLLVDMAFNLLIFFVVCASTEPSDGRKQEIPGSEKSKGAVAQQAENIEVTLSRSTVSLNGSPVKQVDFVSRLKELLKDRTRPEDRIVVVKSSTDTPYEHWITVTGAIEQAGGVTTLQIEESREVRVQ